MFFRTKVCSHTQLHRLFWHVRTVARVYIGFLSIVSVVCVKEYKLKYEDAKQKLLEANGAARHVLRPQGLLTAVLITFPL